MSSLVDFHFLQLDRYNSKSFAILFRFSMYVLQLYRQNKNYNVIFYGLCVSRSHVQRMHICV